MTPFARYLVEQRWKILFTAQGIFMASLYYARFAANPAGPLKALKPNVDLKVDDKDALPCHVTPIPSATSGMWRDEVKATLLRERTEWLDQHSGEDVAILSVTQLVELLHNGHTRRAELEARGIQCHDVSPVPHLRQRRSLKRPRNDESECTSPSAVSFASERVWITGFVRYEQVASKERNEALCLCDATHKIPVHIVSPALELLDGLVLVKSWTVVQHWDTVVIDDSSLSLEIHGDPKLLHHPLGGSTMSLEEAVAAVQTHYKTSDPPMFVGWETWERLKDEAHHDNLAMIPNGSKKKRKIYVVYGRVASVSPTSVQQDPASSHFFLEVEGAEPQAESRSTVNILLAGASSLKWHPFLWPGLLVLVTNLKKVYYAESEMFLLQAPVDGTSADSTSSLFVWRPSIQDPRRQVALLEAFRDDQNGCLYGQTVCLEGVVTSIVWDECLLLDCGIPVLVALFHYPWSDLKDFLRIGSRIHVFHAHLLRRSSVGETQVCVGLCSRSHMRIVAHALPISPASIRRHYDHRRRLHKKWSLFGDFSRQSLALSMWWLDLLEVLAQKFQFQTDSGNDQALHHAFSLCVRRRQATLAIGQDVFSVSPSLPSATPTLARRFLNSHNTNDTDCPSVKQKYFDEDSIIRKVVTLRDLKVLARSLARARAAEVNRDNCFPLWPIRIDACELSELCALGALRGCIATSDLELVDQTTSIPLNVECDGDRSVSVDKGCAVYAFQKFGVIIEHCSDKNHQGQGIEDQELIVSLTVSINDFQRVSFCSNDHTASNGESKEQSRCSVIVLVTRIGPWKRRPKLRGMVGEFRHVRGVGFRLINDPNSQPDWDSLHCADLLVSTECENWFLYVHGWYKFEGTRVNVSSSSQDETLESRLVHHWMSTYGTISTDNERMEQDDQVHVPQTKTEGRAKTCEFVSYVADARAVVTVIGGLNTAPTLVEPGLFVDVDEQTRSCLQSTHELAAKSKRVVQVRELFLVESPEEDSESADTSSGGRTDLHSAVLIDLIGVVQERHLYWKTTVPTTKSYHLQVQASKTNVKKVTRMCRFKIRDTRSLEAVFVTVDEGCFGTMSVLQPGTVVEMSTLQCFIARASFKPFLTWTHSTTARRMDAPTVQTLSDGHIFSQMQMTYLYALYKNKTIDRTIKRFVVQLVHLSYAMLKRRCGECRQPLSLLKRQQAWIHTAKLDETGDENTSKQHRCSWTQITQDSPLFRQKTVLSCSLRGIIDDGSAQAELFLENDMMWELLRCSRGQRQRFEDMLVRQTSELSYFATRSTADALFTTPSMQENAYYQNEWRAFVQSTITALGAFIVYAQRFYKPRPANAAPPTAVLTFGKDIHITTPSVPLLPLEAVRIDELDARRELRRRLGRGGVKPYRVNEPSKSH